MGSRGGGKRTAAWLRASELQRGEAAWELTVVRRRAGELWRGRGMHMAAACGGGELEAAQLQAGKLLTRWW